MNAIADALGKSPAPGPGPSPGRSASAHATRATVHFPNGINGSSYEAFAIAFFTFLAFASFCDPSKQLVAP